MINELIYSFIQQIFTEHVNTKYSVKSWGFKGNWTWFMSSRLSGKKHGNKLQNTVLSAKMQIWIKYYIRSNADSCNKTSSQVSAHCYPHDSSLEFLVFSSRRIFSDLQRSLQNSGKCCPVVLVLCYVIVFLTLINHLLNVILIGILLKEYVFHWLSALTFQ